MDNKQDKGFTLVELLIVIVILGILATVTVFAVRGITDQGQDNACDVESRTLSTAIESYYAQNQEDPASVAALTTAGTNSANVATAPLLTEAPSTADWTFYPAGSDVPAVMDGTTEVSPARADIASAEFVGIGDCAGY
jgi:prepilin-type N-terminal cleavage/methylation domain-containing protein